MNITKLTYLLLQLIFLITPSVIMLTRKGRFPFRLGHALAASIFNGFLFILWNHRFIQAGIWEYNSNYITSIKLWEVPVEEWIFLIFIQLSFSFSYEWAKQILLKKNTPKLIRYSNLIILVGSALIAYFFRNHLFTFFTFFLLFIYFGYTVFRKQFSICFKAYFLSFTILLLTFVPYSWLQSQLPVVIHNPNHILNIGTLPFPIERIAYVFLLLLIHTTLYDFIGKFAIQKQNEQTI